MRFIVVVVHHLPQLDHGSIITSHHGSTVLRSGIAAGCGLQFGRRRRLWTTDQALPTVFTASTVVFVELFDPPLLRLMRDRLDLFF
jgi:hypothetical protein